MNEIRIDSHIRMPRTKKVIRETDKRNKVFRAFANAYGALYTVKPDSYTVQDNGALVIKAGKRICEIAQPKRIEELTRMMRNRIQDRE